MKTLQNHWKSIATFISFLLVSVITFAQDKGVDIDVNLKKESAWYQQPWIWIVGGAVFILLLAAILRGSRKSEA